MGPLFRLPPQETRTYNPLGLSETVSSGSRAKTTYYDVWLGTPSDETFTVGGNPWKFQTHVYDVARNYTAFVDAEGALHEWKYDANTRVYETWYASQKLSNVTFTPGGLVDKTILRDAAGNAITETTMTYDRLGRKARQQTVQLSTGKVVADLEWGYNELDLVVSIKFHHLGAEVTLGYNERRELTSEIMTGNGGGQAAPPYTNQIGDPATGNESLASNEAPATPQGVTAVANRSATYVFDPAGNRTSQTIDGVTTTFTHNGASQLTEESVAGQTVYHHYDEWGNETERGPAPEASTEAYGYNHLNLMSTYTNSTTGANWQYDFWPTGERYAKTNLTTNTAELYIPRAGDVATEYDKASSGTITFKNRYVQGIGIDQKQTRISSTGNRRHYIGDQVGTVDVTLTDAGAVAESGLKDAWGVQLAGGTPSERYGFAQREHDTESGLVHMRARMYDPTLGRFTQLDPLRQGRPRKPYVYTRNNPLSWVDLAGLQEAGVTTQAEGIQPGSVRVSLSNDAPFQTDETATNRVTLTLGLDKTAVQIEQMMWTPPKDPIAAESNPYYFGHHEVRAAQRVGEEGGMQLRAVGGLGVTSEDPTHAEQDFVHTKLTDSDLLDWDRTLNIGTVRVGGYALLEERAASGTSAGLEAGIEYTNLYGAMATVAASSRLALMRQLSLQGSVEYSRVINRSAYFDQVLNQFRGTFGVKFGPVLVEVATESEFLRGADGHTMATVGVEWPLEDVATPR